MITPEISRQRILKTVTASLPTLPLRAIYYAYGLEGLTADCMTKHTDYFRIVLSGQYPIDFGIGSKTQSHILAPGDMLFNLPRSWHREQRNRNYTVFTGANEGTTAVFFLKSCKEPNKEELLHFHSDRPLSKLSDQILALLRQAQTSSAETQRHLGRALAENLMQDLIVAKTAPKLQGQYTWERICQHIAERGPTQVDRQIIAKELNLHPAHVSRLTKTHTGRSLTQHLADLKMQHATSLLKQTTLKIYEIGLLCGYPDPIHFNKVFRKNVGCTPGEYRQKT
jgi:AraC-like DNA-binding protein